MAIPILVLTILSFIRDTIKFIWTLVESHIGYIIHYKNNIKSFHQESEKLKGIAKDVRISIIEAENKGENIKNEVSTWQKREAETTQKIHELEEQLKISRTCCGGWFPDLYFRYKIGKQSAKMSDKIHIFLEEKRCVSVSLPAPPSKFEPPRDFRLSESTKVSLEAAINALQEDTVEVVGLCGVAGVGKTYLARQVGHEAQEKGLFDEVVMAVVSETPNVREIQGQIADKLRLKLLEESEQGRADRLKERIKKCKKILVILDDVWKFMDLSDIGIPQGNELHGSGCICKIIVTTRKNNVCFYTGRQEVVFLDKMSENDSWILFRKVLTIYPGAAGLLVDPWSQEFIAIAKKVVGACQGLPSRIVEVGRALADKEFGVWKIAARQLETSFPTDVLDLEQLFAV